MPKLHFGHCIGCDHPIRPPYLTFKVMHVHGDGNSITEWEEVDVCDDCAGRLTAEDLHRLLSAPEDDVEHLDAVRANADANIPPTAEDIEAAKTAAGGWDRETLARWGVAWPPPKGWKDELLARREVGHAKDPV